MNASELREATTIHVESMDAAVRAAGIVPDEPLAPVLAEWRRSLAWAGELTARMAEIGEAIEVRLAAAPAGGGTATIDPAALTRLEEAAASGASIQAAKLARAHNWRTLALTGAVFVVGAAIAALGGYMAGRSSAVATVSALQAAAVRDGPDGAAIWSTLIANNDGRTVAKSCREAGARSEDGRRVCAVAMWMESPPGSAMPRTAPAK